MTRSQPQVRRHASDYKPASTKPRPRYCGCGVYWPQALDVVRRGESDADHPRSSVQRPSRPQASRQADSRKRRNDRSGLPILEQPAPLARPCKALVRAAIQPRPRTESFRPKASTTTLRSAADCSEHCLPSIPGIPESRRVLPKPSAPRSARVTSFPPARRLSGFARLEIGNSRSKPRSTATLAAAV